MAKSDPLFLLIKAMSGAEKRHFKIDASKFESKSSKNYLCLFDIISNQRVYNEEAIRKKFRNEPYFKQLKSVKLYLQRQIMKSLKNFNNDASSDIKLNGYLTEIEILYKKELFKNCLSIIKKAKLYAEQFEKLSYLVKLIDWEIQVADHSNNIEQVDMLRLQARKKIKELAKSQGELDELRHIYLKSKNFFNVSGETRTKKEETTLQQMWQHPLLKKEMKSFYGENIRLVILAHQAQFKRNLDGISNCIKNIISLYDSHPHQTEEHINTYVDYLLELTTTYMMAKKFGAAIRFFHKTKGIAQKHQARLTLMNRIKLLQTETDLLLCQGELPTALKQIPKINRFLEVNHKKLDPIEELYLHHLKFNVYFKNGDFKNAQYHIHKIIDTNANIRMDVQSTVRIANLILQYEQKEYTHLRYVLRSTYRYLVKKQRLMKPEKIILDFLKKAVRFNSEKQVLVALEALKEQILPFMHQPFLVDFPLIEWIDTKLQNKSLAEIIREGYLNSIALEDAEIPVKGG